MIDSDDSGPQVSPHRRDVALALRAWMAGDHDAVIDLVNSTDDPRRALAEALMVSTFLLRKYENPHGVINFLLQGDGLETAKAEVSAIADARRFLREHLGDGKPQPMTVLRANALAEGITFKSLRNAADYLGVTSTKHPGGHRVWQWPPTARKADTARVQTAQGR